MSDEKILPRYPIYIPSKGRADFAYTAKFLMKDGVPFRVVVEPQEREAYAKVVGEERVLILPFSNLGLGSIPARNWIKEHASKEGHKRHWQLDDNMRGIRRWYKGKRLNCMAGIGLRATEDFTDRYENIAVAGLNYTMFAVGKMPPFNLNCHVYSCTLTLNSLPHKWRGRYNEDTDYCLQVLSDGWCTVLMNAFLVEKITTMKIPGGNTAQLYKGDGRLVMARSLERLWPGVVETKRRFNRPQHVIKNAWRNFDQQLKRRADVDFNALKQTDEYGMKLVQVAESIKSGTLQRFLDEETNSK